MTVPSSKPRTRSSGRLAGQDPPERQATPTKKPSKKRTRLPPSELSSVPEGGDDPEHQTDSPPSAKTPGTKRGRALSTEPSSVPEGANYPEPSAETPSKQRARSQSSESGSVPEAAKAPEPQVHGSPFVKTSSKKRAQPEPSELSVVPDASSDPQHQTISSIPSQTPSKRRAQPPPSKLISVTDGESDPQQKFGGSTPSRTPSEKLGQLQPAGLTSVPDNASDFQHQIDDSTPAKTPSKKRARPQASESLPVPECSNDVEPPAETSSKKRAQAHTPKLSSVPTSAGVAEHQSDGLISVKTPDKQHALSRAPGPPMPDSTSNADHQGDGSPAPAKKPAKGTPASRKTMASPPEQALSIAKAEHSVARWPKIAGKFVWQLAHKLAQAPGSDAVGGEEQFAAAVNSLPAGQLRSELQANIALYSATFTQAMAKHAEDRAKSSKPSAGQKKKGAARAAPDLLQQGNLPVQDPLRTEATRQLCASMLGPPDMVIAHFEVQQGSSKPMATLQAVISAFSNLSACALDTSTVSFFVEQVLRRATAVLGMARRAGGGVATAALQELRLFLRLLSLRTAGGPHLGGVGAGPLYLPLDSGLFDAAQPPAAGLSQAEALGSLLALYAVELSGGGSGAGITLKGTRGAARLATDEERTQHLLCVCCSHLGSDPQSKLEFLYAVGRRICQQGPAGAKPVANDTLATVCLRQLLELSRRPTAERGSLGLLGYVKHLFAARTVVELLSGGGSRGVSGEARALKARGAAAAFTPREGVLEQLRQEADLLLPADNRSLFRDLKPSSSAGMVATDRLLDSRRISLRQVLHIVDAAASFTFKDIAASPLPQAGGEQDDSSSLDFYIDVAGDKTVLEPQVVHYSQVEGGLLVTADVKASVGGGKSGENSSEDEN